MNKRKIKGQKKEDKTIEKIMDETQSIINSTGSKEVNNIEHFQLKANGDKWKIIQFRNGIQ